MNLKKIAPRAPAATGKDLRPATRSAGPLRRALSRLTRGRLYYSDATLKHHVQPR